MPLRLSVPTPLEYFAALVQGDAGFPLLEAAASIAQDEYPQLDVQQVLGEMDHLLWRLRRRVAADAPAVQRLRVLNQFFFGTLGFGGNVNHYHAPANSPLNEVLRTRRGIPVSLAVLWLELAQSVGLRVQGVAFPGHFLVRALLAQGQVLLDPLTGRSLAREDLIELLAPGPQQALALALALDAEGAALHPYLQAATPRETVARMLRNLLQVHRMQQDWPRALAVLERLVILLPQDGEPRRDRGLAHAACGHAVQAVEDLRAYLALRPDAPDAASIAERIRSLQ